MGRHADPSARRRFEISSLLQPRLLTAVFVAVALVAGGIVWAVGWHPGCGQRVTVRVAVAPELDGLAHRLLADSLPAGDSCAAAVVTARQPLQTAADLGTLQSTALPEVWVPDSSLWTARAGSVRLSPAGSLGSSPIVLATSKAEADSLGWSGSAPTWADAVKSGRPLAMPDLATSAEGLSALSAVRSSLGGGQDADTAVVQAVLAAQRAGARSVSDSLTAGRDGAADAPLAPVSEQEVFATNQKAPQSALVAVYPRDGSPRLDYPVLRVGQPAAADRAAVDAVVARLTSATAHDAARSFGLRDAKGTPPPGAADHGLRPDAPRPMSLDPGQVQQLVGRLTSLARPSRILAVFDVSLSMQEPVGDSTRVNLARDAAKSALSLVPDASAIGLWDFAYHLSGNDDWSPLVPVRPLGDNANGTSQRRLIADQLDSLPNKVAPGGTGLYDTTLAAVRSARSSYDPAAVNSVLLVTDGGNDDDTTDLTLAQLVDKLHGEADPSRPVKVIAVGLGHDADMDALKQIADATGGAAYSAVDPRDLQTVLFDAIRQRQ